MATPENTDSDIERWGDEGGASATEHTAADGTKFSEADIERWGAEAEAGIPSSSLGEPQEGRPGSPTRAWTFIEDNDWEGEEWTVFFSSSDPEVNEKLEQLEEYMEADSDESPYDLYEIEDLPDEDELEDDDDGAGYYAPEAIRELVVRKLDLALEFFAQGGPENTELDDPLYKLGLFDENDR